MTKMEKFMQAMNEVLSLSPTEAKRIREKYQEPTRPRTVTRKDIKKARRRKATG